MQGLIRIRLNGQQRSLLAEVSRRRGLASAGADENEAAGLLIARLADHRGREELGATVVLYILGYQLYLTADQWEPEPDDEIREKLDKIRERLDEILKVVRGIDSGETV